MLMDQIFFTRIRVNAIFLTRRREDTKTQRLQIVGVEDFLVEILEGEVEGLGGEVPDDVGQVASPEGREALLRHDTSEAVANAVVAVLLLDRRRRILHLKQQLDTLDGGSASLGHGSRDTTGKEVNYEIRHGAWNLFDKNDCK